MSRCGRRHLAKEIGLSLRLKDYTGQGSAMTLPMLTAHDCEAEAVSPQVLTPVPRIMTNIARSEGMTDI
jgi:hypothetical protein